MTAAFLAAALTVRCLAAAETSPRVLKRSPFSSEYMVAGYLRMPHHELKEPFRAYYDQNANKSRVDYHDGDTKTFRIGSEFHKVVWSPNVKTHVPEENCFRMTAERSDGKFNGILPDLIDFKFVRVEPCNTDLESPPSEFPFNDMKCSRFERNTENRDHTSKSVFWAIQDTEGRLIPVRYLVVGYDTLLKSYFDEYEVVYNEFSPGPVNPDLFVVRSVTDKSCVGFPSQPGLPVHHLFDPMMEFAHHDQSHVDEHFSSFKDQHGKSYATRAEERERRNNFLHNMRYVNSLNRRNLSYALKLNHLSDLSRSELKSHASCAGRSKIPPGSKPESYTDDELRNVTLPDAVDWRLEGAITPVKNQGHCGSCWAFATAALLESRYFLRHQKLVRLSEQEMVDCAWGYHSNGCHGGQPYGALQYVEKYGLSSDSQYGPYLEENGKCREFKIKNKTITTVKNVRYLSERDDLRRFIALRGPVIVEMEARESLKLYSHGVYEEPACGSGHNHALLAVGYGTVHGKPYWLIRNSWGVNWGVEGYFLISRGSNNCEVESHLIVADL